MSEPMTGVFAVFEARVWLRQLSHIVEMSRIVYSRDADGPTYRLICRVKTLLRDLERELEEVTRDD